MALISYRGRPRHRHRDTLEDLRASVRYVRSVAEERGIDPRRIGATGRSAGGTLAALLAVNGGPTEQGGGIQAAVCFAGVFDFVGRFTDKEQLALQPRSEIKIKSNGEWIGPPFSSTNKEWLEASPITHVGAHVRAHLWGLRRSSKSTAEPESTRRDGPCQLECCRVGARRASSGRAPARCCSNRATSSLSCHATASAGRGAATKLSPSTLATAKSQLASFADSRSTGVHTISLVTAPSQPYAACTLDEV